MPDTATMLDVVFVCTGNRCRSPMAEAFVRELGRDLPLSVGSAGLLDLGPVGAPAEVLEVTGGLGVELSAHKARSLASVDVSSSDLVIGFEHGHVAAAVVEAGVPPERAFTLMEIVRLLESIEPPDADDPEERARLSIARADQLRKTTDFVANEDIADPFGGRRKVYAASASQISDLSGRLVAGLFGRARVSSG
jgi:protein-tyrosine phosphatase